MLKYKPTDTLIEPTEKGETVGKKSRPTNRDRYQRLVGKLIYLIHTQLDLVLL